MKIGKALQEEFFGGQCSIYAKAVQRLELLFSERGPLGAQQEHGINRLEELFVHEPNRFSKTRKNQSLGVGPVRSGHRLSLSVRLDWIRPG